MINYHFICLQCHPLIWRIMIHTLIYSTKYNYSNLMTYVTVLVRRVHLMLWLFFIYRSQFKGWHVAMIGKWTLQHYKGLDEFRKRNEPPKMDLSLCLGLCCIFIHIIRFPYGHMCDNANFGSQMSNLHTLTYFYTSTLNCLQS